MYPKYLLKRKETISLDGLWKLNDLDIKVPYVPEAKSSMYHGEILEKMTYTKTFSVPESFKNKRIFLYFGAVDQICDVYLNKEFLIHHEDGYLPFEVEITDYIKEENYLEVRCIDSLDKTYPYGKQAKTPKGMWYTPVSFIWQSVYIIAKGQNYIEDIKITSSMSKVKIETKGNFDSVKILIDQDDIHFEKIFNKEIEIDFKKAGLSINLWEIDNPYLYHFKLKTSDDEIESYFALREFNIKEIKGYKRLLLNDKPLFLCALLDQGYFDEDLYTVIDIKKYEEDIIKAKALGYNCLRKHIKIENDGFYEAADRLGMIVIQDFVNSGPYSFIKDTVLPNIGFKKKNDKVKNLDKRHELFIRHAERVQELLYSHPSIIAYTIFNEGWGQFNSDEIYKHLKKRDPLHLYDTCSGWFYNDESDFDSEHVYFRNKVLKSKGKALILSECGGYIFSDEANNYGYGKSKDNDSFIKKLDALYKDMIYPSIKYGLNGFVYTQICDVESERNGLYKANRDLKEIDYNHIKELNDKCHKLLKEVIDNEKI